MTIRITSHSGGTVPREYSPARATRGVRRARAASPLLATVAACAALAIAALAVSAEAAESGPALSGVVNLNTASTEELQLLPGVGEVRAVAIVTARKDRGGFKQVDDLLDVKGIGPAMLQRLRPYVTLSGKTTARKL